MRWPRAASALSSARQVVAWPLPQDEVIESPRTVIARPGIRPPRAGASAERRWPARARARPRPPDGDRCARPGPGAAPRRRSGCASAAPRPRTICATAAPSSATRTSRPGSRNISMPRQRSVIRQAPAPAASNTRVAGDQPLRAMLSRLMLRTQRAVQLSALWSRVETWPSRRTFAGTGLSSQPLPPKRKLCSGACAAALKKNSSTRASRSGRRLPRKARSQAKRGAVGTG